MLFSCSISGNNPDIKRYEEQADNVTIIRDMWGVPHIYGKTDADAVFGMMYAQCEESFERVERNYIEKLGRMSEVEGEAYLYSDLLMQFIYDTTAAKADYQNSPPWFKKILHAFADGINYYLYKNQATKPALLKRFEPWYPLLFTDGGYTALQTGGLEMEDIRRLYSVSDPSSIYFDALKKNEATGSNAFAIGPSRSANKNALLYINPHVSFYFRTEMHVVSEEGLNAYGAVTWGQFFVFQGFNEHCGWMHTSSQADAVDLYAEKINRRGDSTFYEYDELQKPVIQKQYNISYKKGSAILSRSVTGYKTHHGPVVGSRDKNWLSIKEKNRSLNGLIQSWQRTKAKSFEEFKSVMQLRTNVATNTMYADITGNISYWHGNFMPKRNPALNWDQPVDGSTSATEWNDIHELDEMIQIQNPKQGWLQNCNSSPFHVAGFNTIDRKMYPAYMAPDGENFRSLYAITQMEKETNYTIDKLIGLGYDHYLAMFDTLLPPLINAFDALASFDPLRLSLKDPMDTLRRWDKRSAIPSVATTLAVEWAYYLINTAYKEMPSVKENDQVVLFTLYGKNISGQKKLEMLNDVVEGLKKAYGSWKIPWGDINRYQRINRGEKFDDNKPSLPVGMASALFGSLPSYEVVWQNTNKGYGTSGNSFVAAVEFGKKIKAKSIVTGGQFFDPSSKHYTDQATMFIEGKFKDVLFYKEDVVKNAERTYHPGK